MWIIETEAIWESIINQNEQMEFDWLGIDSIGHLAVFSTFNSGFTPKCVTNSMTQYNELVNFLETIKETSEIIKITKAMGKYDDWEEFARKGIFGYDNENIHSVYKPNRYHLIYQPQNPIKVNTIPNLEKFKQIVPVFNIEFKDFLEFSELKNALI